MSDTPHINELLEQVRAATAEVNAATAEQRAARKADQEANAKTQETLASRRRSGELGRDWQVLQQRIDMRQTTLEDILQGVDLSTEARAVRKQIQKDVIPRMREQFAESISGEEMTTHLAQLQQAQRDLRDALDTVQRLSGSR